MQEFKKVGETQVYIGEDGRFGYRNEKGRLLWRKTFAEVERELTRDKVSGKLMVLKIYGLQQQPETEQIISVKKVTRGYRKVDAFTTSEGKVLDTYEPLYAYDEVILTELKALNQEYKALSARWHETVKLAKRLSDAELRARLKGGDKPDNAD